MGTKNTVLHESLIKLVALYGGNKLIRKCTRAFRTIRSIILLQLTQKIVKKSVSYNLWNHMRTTNSEVSPERRLIKFVHLMKKTYSESRLEERLIQPVASWWDNKLKW